jgi:HTH-type transcriptional regulator/antitoxin HigA
MNRYLELIRRFPLRPLRCDENLDRAMAMADELSDRIDDLVEEERDYLDVLSDLIERYEEEHIAIPSASDEEMLQFLIESKGVSQAQVAKECRIAASTLSMVIAGRRNLTRDHIGRLSRYFNVEPGVFSFDA